MELWNNAEISEYLIAAAIELEKERLNAIQDTHALQIWLVQSVGALHACFHNSGMAGYKEALTANPVFKNMPDRIRKMLGYAEEEKIKEMTDEDMFLLTATKSQKEAYFLSKDKA